MNKPAVTVFVLGAGFTRAFVPAAPLMTGDYSVSQLREKLKAFPFANRALELELRRTGNGGINIERLMTRLDSGMPYDERIGGRAEYALLLNEVTRVFIDALSAGKAEKWHQGELQNFARYCVTKPANCITFNHDDTFDEALWVASGKPPEPTPEGWHPGFGYGFRCREVSITINLDVPNMERPTMLLLKLHGSVNWFARRGASKPYAIDDVVHWGGWFDTVPQLDLETIDVHVESGCIIVPPVLTKSELMEQPILRVEWSLAYQKLREANEVAFIGYSLPVTDIAAATLFNEAVQPTAKVTVINRGETDEAQLRTRNVYQAALSRDDIEFVFEDARAWINRRVAG